MEHACILYSDECFFLNFDQQAFALMNMIENSLNCLAFESIQLDILDLSVT